MNRVIRFLVTACVGLAALGAEPAAAAEEPATPPSGTLSAATPALSWGGGPFTGSTTDPLGADCVNSTCSIFNLTVAGTDPLTQTVRIRIDWALPTNDLDLHVVDALTGAIVKSSGESATNFEEVTFPAAPGSYVVQTLIYRAVAESYTGAATLITGEPEPQPVLRTGNYQHFDFGFTSEVKLPEQERSTIFIDQDVEPEIEVDRFGTIYIGAIRGVPTGADFWRSDDGGASFQYLGQPDGAQSPAPFPVPSPEGGAGGGDVDIALGDPFDLVPATPGSPAIRSAGRVYVTSLWLGSATLSVSVDRGDNWVANPFTTAQLDRQWNVAKGENTLYMSLRKLAQIVEGKHDVYALKAENGLLFTEGSFVQDPDDPKSIPDDVGGNSVLTSDEVLYGTFVSSDGTKLYLWRAPKVGPGPPEFPTPPAEAPPLPNPPDDYFAVGLIFEGNSQLTTNNTFPIMTVDAADNLHVAFGDRHNIYLMSCPAGLDPTIAANWTLPVPLNAPDVPGFEFTRTTMFPWIRGGAPGKVAAIWYASDVTGDPDSPVFETAQAPWKIVYAQVEDALSATPTVYLQVASQQGGGVVHTGQICVRGTGCPNGTRELAEYSSVTVDNQGFANIAYAGTIHDGVNPASSGALTFFTKSTQRPVVDPPVTDQVDCDDPRVSRKGGWHAVSDARATQGHYCRNVGADRTNAPAYLEFEFSGSEVDMQIARGPRGGNAEVFIDGVSQGEVDFFRPPSDPAHPDHSGREDLTFGQFVTFAAGPGAHTFRLDVLNEATEPQGPKRDMIYVDGFVVRDGGAQGTGNPIETSVASQGTVSPSPDPLGGALQTVTATSHTELMTAVLEVEEGSSLDLLLLDPAGQVIATSATSGPTEVLRWVPSDPGVYTFVALNAGSTPSPYEMWVVQAEGDPQPTVSAPSHPHPNVPALEVGVRYTTPPGPTVRLAVSTAHPGLLRAQLFDVKGRLVRTLADESYAAAGRREFTINARSDQLGSGVYFYRVQAARGTASGRLTVLGR